MQQENTNIIDRIINYGTFIMGDGTKFEGIDLNLGASTNLDAEVRGEKMHRKFPSFYFLITQLLPGILAISPFVIIVTEQVKDASWILELSLPVQVLLLSLAIVIPALLLSYPIAFISQVFECRIFAFKLRYPSTYLLLDENEKLSSVKKASFRRKFDEVFKDQFPIQDGDDETSEEYLVSIAKSMFKLRQQIKKSYMLHHLTIRYDFTRNSIAAAKMIILFAPFFLIYGVLKSNQIIIIGEVLAILFALTLVINQTKTLVIAAENYARQLIDEFLYQ